MLGITNFELVGTPLSWVLAVLGVLLMVLQGRKSWTRKAVSKPMKLTPTIQRLFKASLYY
jgi:hypothetical protein